MAAEGEDARVRLLEAMTTYLEARLQNQLTSFAQVDQKVSVRIAVCAGLVVVVGFLLPGTATAPSRLFWCGMATVAVCVLCLVRTLWLALSSLEITAALPPVQVDSFLQLAKMEAPNLADGLRGIVGSYLKAVQANSELIARREAPGNALVRWSRATLVVSLVAVMLLLALHVIG